MTGQYKADRNMLTTADDGRRGGPPRLLIIHDQGVGDSTADALAEYCLNPANDASYHVIIDRTGRMVRSNDDAWIPWSAGWTGNRAGLHVCLTGSFTSRDAWMARGDQLARLREWIEYNSNLYGIPAVRLGPDRLNPPHRGVCGHRDVSQAWHETDHTDPSAAFPYDAVLSAGTAPEPARTHVVQRGETLWSIAQDRGLEWEALARRNCIKEPHKLRVGTILRLRD